jgi:hypothetical protein
MKKRTFLLVAPIALSIPALFAPPAHAGHYPGHVDCYGDYCSGRNPESSGCSADAYTVAHARIAGTYVNVELRWSPRCQTNWARTGWPGAYNPNNLYAVQAQTGYTQRGVVGSNPTYVWTRMIYSPRLGVSARYDGPPGGGATAFA